MITIVYSLLRTVFVSKYSMYIETSSMQVKVVS